MHCCVTSFGLGSQKELFVLYHPQPSQQFFLPNLVLCLHHLSPATEEEVEVKVKFMNLFQYYITTPCIWLPLKFKASTVYKVLLVFNFSSHDNQQAPVMATR